MEWFNTGIKAASGNTKLSGERRWSWTLKAGLPPLWYFIWWVVLPPNDKRERKKEGKEKQESRTDDGSLTLYSHQHLSWHDRLTFAPASASPPGPPLLSSARLGSAAWLLDWGRELIAYPFQRPGPGTGSESEGWNMAGRGTPRLII